MLLPALAFTTAMSDVLSWLSLGRVYTANITGDLTQSATYILPGERAHVLQLLAGPVLAVGLVVSYVAVHRLSATYILAGERVHVLQLLAGPVFAVGLVVSYVAVHRLQKNRFEVMRGLLLVQALLLLLLATACLSGAFGPWIGDAGARRVAAGLTAIFTIALSDATMNMLDKGAPTTWARTADCVRGGVALLNLLTHNGSPEMRVRDLRLAVDPAHGAGLPRGRDRLRGRGAPGRAARLAGPLRVRGALRRAVLAVHPAAGGRRSGAPPNHGELRWRTSSPVSRGA